MYSEDFSKPLYVKIAEEIRSRINSGEYAPGSLIQSEAKLSKEYNVSRVTVRQAVAILAEERLVIKRQGLGTFVTNEPIHQELSELKTITEVLLARGMKPKIKVISYGRTVPSESVKEALNLGQKGNALQIKRLYFVGASPLCLVTIFLPTKYENIAQPLKKSLPETETTYTIFERAGILPDRARHVIKSVEADQEAARLLNIKIGTPILCLERTTYLAEGTPLECICFQYRADRFVFEARLPRRKSSSSSSHDGLLDGILGVLNQ